MNNYLLPQLRAAGTLTALIIGVTALAGCTAQVPAPTPPPTQTVVPLVDSKLMVDEYYQTIEEFPEPLPGGVSFATEIPTSFDLEGQSEPGVGQSFAYFYWACAWQQEFILGYDDEDLARQTQALDMLERWKETEFYAAHYDDPDDLWTTLMIDPARAGNPTELISYFENGCGYYIENNR